LFVNVTNDGWFWGSSILDFHLACGVFRAIENRLPLVMAANTGISAFIDSNGRVISRGPRRDEAVLFAEIHPVAQTSWYQTLGDIPAGLCLLFCGFLGGVGLIRGRWPAKPAERLE
jgi:apolipoprotein N-acyltransferase